MLDRIDPAHQQVRRDGAKEKKISQQHDHIMAIILVLDLHVVEESMHLPSTTPSKAVQQQNDILMKKTNDGKVGSKSKDVVDAFERDKAVCEQNLHDGRADEQIVLHRQTLFAGEEGDALGDALVREDGNIKEEKKGPVGRGT